MSDYGPFEVIDGLCRATEELAGIVRKQAEVLAQADIPEELAQELQKERDGVDNALDVLEYKMRRI